MEKQVVRNSLIEKIESELKKDAGDIRGDLIDSLIEELYALDSRSPPKLGDEQLDAAARTVRARAAWRRRNTLAEGALKRRLTRRALRGVWAACCAFLLLFSVNYVTTQVTGSCLPSKAGIKICCGTTFCPCGGVKGEKENPSHP
ncbi:MAG: hypothetical protein LBO80_02600, partial [Treponema sp.]|nr:hypothetical protein [Treponema sp.]